MKLKATVIYTLRYEAQVELEIPSGHGTLVVPVRCSEDMDENPILFDELLDLNDEILQQLPIPEEKAESDIEAFYVEDSFKITQIVI